MGLPETEPANGELISKPPDLLLDPPSISE